MRLQPRLTTALAALVLAPTLAFAHATKTETTPADGATLASGPPTLEIAFDAPMRITTLEIADADGDSYDLDYVRGRPVTDFRAKLPDLPPGTYRVHWRGLSDDGHPSSGSFSFTIE